MMKKSYDDLTFYPTILKSIMQNKSNKPLDNGKLCKSCNEL